MKKNLPKELCSMLMVGTMAVGLLAGCGGSTEETSTSDKTQDTAKTESVDSTEMANGEGTDWYQKSGEFSMYVYYTGTSQEQVDASLVLMKERYPNVTINVEHRSDSDGAVLKTRAAVGELPDIFESTGTLTDILIKSGDIVSLDDVVEEKGMVDKYINGLFDGRKSPDGKYYTLEAGMSIARIYYNKRVFQELGLEEPKNYPEFLELVKTLKKNDVIPLALFAQQKWPGLQMYDWAVVGQGEPMGLTGLEDGSTKITDPAYKAAAEKIVELVNEGFIGKGAFNTNADQAFELVETGRAAMLFNGDWFFQDSMHYQDEIGYFEYNPFVDPGKEEAYKWNVSGGINTPGGYAVSATGKDVEFAKRLTMDYIECRTKVLTQKFGAPNFLKEEVLPEIPVTDSYKKFCADLGKIQTKTKFEWSLNDPEMITLLENNSELLYTGSYSVDDFIKDTEAAINDTLQ